jgi:hypothetical protein
MKNLFKAFVSAIIATLILVAIVPQPQGVALGLEFHSGVFALCFSVQYLLIKNQNALNAHSYGVTVEVWVKYIIERLFKDNKFMQHVYNDDQYVLQGKVVHIPQAGAKPTVVKNRAVFPAVAVQRTDTDVNYTLDNYSTDPTHLPNAESAEISYDKMNSVYGDHVSVLGETICDDLLIKWAANITSLLRTTGGAAAGTVAPIAGQVGTRKGFHHKDLQKAMILFNTQNIAKERRYALIEDNMFEFFYDSLSDNQQKNFSEYVDAKNGVVGRLHGFDIMTRSSVLALTSADAVKALGSAMAATDNLATMVWQENSIAKALGEVKFFQNTDDALFYGDVYSSLARAGGRVRRADAAGISLIVQAA